MWESTGHGGLANLFTHNETVARRRTVALLRIHDGLVLFRDLVAPIVSACFVY